MNRITFLVALILTLLIGSARANAQPVRLSTVQPVLTAIAGVKNYAAVIVEGAPPETRLMQIVAGPGQLLFEKPLKRWLWMWQPAAADLRKSYSIRIKDQAGTIADFEVQVKNLAEDRSFIDLKRHTLYSGIPTTIRIKQPGLDGAYRMKWYLDEKLIVDSSEPTITIKPSMNEDVGKRARLDIEYTAPLTGKSTLLGSYSARVQYPPLRSPTSLEVDAGECLLFKAAMGLPPNFYTPVPGRFFIVKSDGYFEDTAQMISRSISEGEDPFGLFAPIAKLDTASSGHLSFDFGLRPTDKMKTITDKSGKSVLLTLVEPVTNQVIEIEVRIFPPWKPARE